MDKHKERRLQLLAGEIGVLHPLFSTRKFSVESELKQLEKYTGSAPYMKKRLELIRLLKETGWTDAECLKFWYNRYMERWKQKANYRRKPNSPRKDNPNTYGEPFIGGGTRRRPRKKAKTAWKRFYKIFPNEK